MFSWYAQKQIHHEFFYSFQKNKYVIRKETKGRWERRRGKSDTLGRGGFAPLIGWILNSGHRQTTTLRPLASSATMIEICIRREVKHSDKVHDLVRGANSPHDFREKCTWSTYPVKKRGRICTLHQSSILRCICKSADKFQRDVRHVRTKHIWENGYEIITKHFNSFTQSMYNDSILYLKIFFILYIIY